MLNIRFRERTNAWPGFVDLFSNLVIVLIFLLMIFLFLFATTSVFNKNSGAQKVASLTKENQAQSEQIDLMTADRQEADQLLIAARDALESQETQAINLANAYENQISEMSAKHDELTNEIENLTARLTQAELDKENLAKQEEETTTQILNQANSEIEDLNRRIAGLEYALAQMEESAKQRDVEYIEMSNQLNKALADKVAELSALGEYQSEFYRQIKDALGDSSAIKQSGDRFIVSSDILFPSGSYKISADGKKQLAILAGVIKDMETKIPNDINWIIRVDGHTDNKAVLPDTVGYKNNMQLSLLRATAVVNELVKDGVAKKRLVPSGFGEMYPIANGADAASLQKNRRIELQLTNK